MKPKFEIGDKVIVNPATRRVPKYILNAIRLNRKRTIISRYYNKHSEHMRYYLGSNQRGEDISSFAFRSDELTLATKRKVGKPKIKRKYKRINGKIP